MKTAMIDMQVSLSLIREYSNSTLFYQMNDDLIYPISEEDCELAESGHGDLCLKSFNRGAGASVDVFVSLRQDCFGNCNVGDLAKALMWCIECEVDLISLSMGTTLYHEAKIAYDIVKHAYTRGVTIVASACNERILTYPACFGYCIGVAIEKNESIPKASFSYQENTFDGIDVIISPYTLCGDYLGSNSVATAYFAGLLLRNVYPNKNVRKWLEDNSISFTLRNEYEYIRNYIFHSSSENTIVIAVINPIISEKLSDELKQIFLRRDYHCISIVTAAGGIRENDFLTYEYVYNSNSVFSLFEYIQLITSLCHPDIILVNCYDYNSFCADVVVSDTVHSNIGCLEIIVSANISSPLEVADIITDFFA